MKTLLCLLIGFSSLKGTSQLPETDSLFLTLKSFDSLLFTVGYNNCDIKQFELLIHKDFEFYHDQGGMIASKKAFINSIQDGICKLTYKPSRVLIDGSLEVFPLTNNGVIYGAIQKGEHAFYANEEGKETYLTSTATFTHLWILNNGIWQLSRVLSYDHQLPTEKE